MSEQTGSPRTSTANQAPSEPKWTTGQGIGFLVSFIGWVLAVLGLVGLMGAGEGADGEAYAVLGLLAGLGVLSAIPGTIVFKKCKRPQQ